MFNLTTQEKRVLTGLIILVLAGFILSWYMNRLTRSSTQLISGSESQKGFAQKTTAAGTSGTTGRLIIHIEGAVKKPGIYELPYGSRIYQAIRLAGDTTAEADTRNINFAETISDGEKIVIPSRIQESNPALLAMPPGISLSQPQEFSANQGAMIRTPPSSRKVNINSATEYELDQLPGIGATYARRIVEYRQTHGRFRRIDEIKNVRGIGDKRFEDIRNQITAD